MATKSFTTDLSFNRKSAAALIETLGKYRKPVRSTPSKVTEVKDKAELERLFRK